MSRNESKRGCDHLDEMVTVTDTEAICHGCGRRWTSADVPCQRCGLPSGVSVATLQANGANLATCSACVRATEVVDP